MTSEEVDERLNEVTSCFLEDNPRPELWENEAQLAQAFKEYVDTWLEAVL